MVPKAEPKPKTVMAAVAFCTVIPFCLCKKSTKYELNTPHGTVPGKPCASTRMLVFTSNCFLTLLQFILALYETSPASSPLSSSSSVCAVVCSSESSRSATFFVEFLRIVIR